MLGLVSGERLVADSFATRAEAEARARSIVNLFEDAEERHWPRVGERLVRPSAVLFVEVVSDEEIASLAAPRERSQRADAV